VRSEKFKVAGVTHYLQNIESLADENDDYYLSNRELMEAYSDGDRIYQYEFSPYLVELIPEPENEFDSNAVRVDIDGLTVGYIKKGSCTHVKNLLAAPDFHSVTVDSMGLGKYKEIYEDEDGELHVEKGELSGCWVHIRVTNGKFANLSPELGAKTDSSSNVSYPHGYLPANSHIDQRNTEKPDPPVKLSAGATLLVLVGLLFVPVSLICFFIKIRLGFCFLFFSLGIMSIGSAISEQDATNRKNVRILAVTCIIIAVILYVIQ
jgi:hypothetical protein